MSHYIIIRLKKTKQMFYLKKAGMMKSNKGVKIIKKLGDNHIIKDITNKQTILKDVSLFSNQYTKLKDVEMFAHKGDAKVPHLTFYIKINNYCFGYSMTHSEQVFKKSEIFSTFKMNETQKFIVLPNGFNPGEIPSSYRCKVSLILPKIIERTEIDELKDKIKRLEGEKNSSEKIEEIKNEIEEIKTKSWTYKIAESIGIMGDDKEAINNVFEKSTTMLLLKLFKEKIDLKLEGIEIGRYLCESDKIGAKSYIEDAFLKKVHEDIESISDIPTLKKLSKDINELQTIAAEISREEVIYDEENQQDHDGN